MTRREIEVLALVGARLSNADIAGRLQLSVRTVENHVSSLLRKYGVADRRALAEVAAQVAAGVPEPGRLAGAPAALTRFIGRDFERALLLGALRDGRLVTLHGPGGVGKTRLAVEVARAAGSLFPSRRMFIDLIPVRDGYVAQAVAAALGVSERPGESLEDAIAVRMGDGRFLLILDNCEHVIDSAAAFTERVLSACPGVRILATSRERLGVRGERTVRLGPLPLGSDAEILFTERASGAGPGFAADPAAVAEICARLDGLPLAIELAAARIPALGVGGVLAGLDDCLQLVAGGRGADARHHSLRAVIGWSYDLLDDEERGFFRHLAVFAGAFALNAASAVTSAGGRAKVADLLGRLVDKNLVVHQRGTPGRWRLLDTVRAFAAERLRADGEAAGSGRWGFTPRAASNRLARSGSLSCSASASSRTVSVRGHRTRPASRLRTVRSLSPARAANCSCDNSPDAGPPARVHRTSRAAPARRSPAAPSLLPAVVGRFTRAAKIALAS